MSTQFRYVACFAALTVMAVCVSCDKSPTSPRPPQGGPAAPGTAPSLVRIELAAPPQIAPGESVQLTANAIRSDGSVENVTSTARWTSTSQILSVSPSGLVTGGARGEDGAVRVRRERQWRRRRTRRQVGVAREPVR